MDGNLLLHTLNEMDSSYGSYIIFIHQLFDGDNCGIIMDIELIHDYDDNIN